MENSFSGSTTEETSWGVEEDSLVDDDSLNVAHIIISLIAAETTCSNHSSIPSHSAAPQSELVNVIG